MDLETGERKGGGGRERGKGERRRERDTHTQMMNVLSTNVPYKNNVVCSLFCLHIHNKILHCQFLHGDISKVIFLFLHVSHSGIGQSCQVIVIPERL